MFCAKCGSQNDKGAKFCGKCGAPMSVEEGVAETTEVSEEACPKSTPMSVALNVVGVLLFVVAVIDFAGMFFGYDITGVSWSPIAFGFVGGLCRTVAEKLKK